MSTAPSLCPLNPAGAEAFPGKQEWAEVGILGQDVGSSPSRAEESVSGDHPRLFGLCVGLFLPQNPCPGAGKQQQNVPACLPALGGVAKRAAAAILPPTVTFPLIIKMQKEKKKGCFKGKRPNQYFKGCKWFEMKQVN